MEEVVREVRSRFDFVPLLVRFWLGFGSPGFNAKTAKSAKARGGGLKPQIAQIFTDTGAVKKLSGTGGTVGCFADFWGPTGGNGGKEGGEGNREMLEARGRKDGGLVFWASGDEFSLLRRFVYVNIASLFFVAGGKIEKRN